MLDDAQPSDCQIINLQRADSRFPDDEATDGNVANRQCTDGERADRCRAQHKRRQLVSRENGSGPGRHIARHHALTGRDGAGHHGREKCPSPGRRT